MKEELILEFCKKSECNIIFTDKVSLLDSEELNKNFKVVNVSVLENYLVSLELKDSNEVKNSKIIIPTSGTSGKPKLLHHNFQSLSRTIKKQNNKENFSWGLLYGLTKFAGLQVLLQSFLTCNELSLLDLSRPLKENINILIKNNCNCLSATPTMFRKLLMNSNFCKLNLKQITLGGEIVDQQILNFLRNTFPEANITHIYASTEAGVGFSIKDCKEGFPINLLKNESNSLNLRISKENHLLIKNNNIKDKEYTHVNKDLLKINNEGYFDTGDKVKIVKDRVIFLGRANGTINVGGNKVQPEEIERIIINHPEVMATSVSGRKNSITGEIVFAKIVIKDISMQKEVKKQIISQFKKMDIEPYKIPGILKVVNEIETNDSGKVVRS
jgi:acyl-coenzyme A synthetase/AMP-(fatty) acid ligase